jgi:hypothetical protein
MNPMQTSTTLTGGWQDVDGNANELQLRQIRGYLGSATVGLWMETNGRFYFQLEQDFEMFKTMCLIGWS